MKEQPNDLAFIYKKYQSILGELGIRSVNDLEKFKQMLTRKVASEDVHIAFMTFCNKVNVENLQSNELILILNELGFSSENTASAIKLIAEEVKRSLDTYTENLSEESIQKFLSQYR